MKSMRGLFVVLLLAGIALLSLSFMSRPAYTQHELRSPDILREMTHDISAPLRDMTPAAHRIGPPEERDIRLLHQPRDIEKFVDPVLQLSTLPKVSTTGGSSVGGIGANGSAPPDTNGSVGATQFVEWVNTEFAVYNKANGALVLGPLEGNTLWSGFGGGCQTNNDGDIIVLWDKLNKRWVMSQFSVSTTPFNQCVAVSTTADATGTWARYAFQQPAFNDYPKLGVWPDAYYVTYNMFNSTGTLFEGSRLCAMDSAAMRAGNCCNATVLPARFKFWRGAACGRGWHDSSSGRRARIFPKFRHQLTESLEISCGLHDDIEHHSDRAKQSAGGYIQRSVRRWHLHSAVWSDTEA